MSRRRRSNDEVVKKVYGRLMHSLAVTDLKGDKKYGFKVAGMTHAGVGMYSEVSIEVAGTYIHVYCYQVIAHVILF